MKKFLTGLFIVLGVVFVCLLLIGLGYYLSTSGSTSFQQSVEDALPGANTTPTPMPTEAVAFTLSAAQRQALIDLGVDPSVIPDTISPAQQACFIGAIGEEKFAEVQQGAVPSTIDFLKVRGCL